jgi:hypothetical protein
MKPDQLLKVTSTLFLVAFSWVSAKDDALKLKGEIISLSVNARTVRVADMTFWIDAKTKIEDANSIHLSFSDLEPGDFVELEYNPPQINLEGFGYASKIELGG